MLQTEDFQKYMDSVVKWNELAKGEKPNHHDVWDLQTKVTDEEIKETFKALDENDDVELADGTADIFVTFGYKISLLKDTLDLNWYQKQSLECAASTPILFFDSTFIEEAPNLETIISEINAYNLKTVENLDKNTFKHVYVMTNLLWNLLVEVENHLKIDIEKVIEDVLYSNWTKFPLYEAPSRSEFECDWIQKERGQENVNFFIIDDGKRVVYRNGYGKIMKPSTFVSVDHSKWGM